MAYPGQMNKGTGSIAAWIPHDELMTGFPKLGRQAYFEDELCDSPLFDALGNVAVDETPENL